MERVCEKSSASWTGKNRIRVGNTARNKRGPIRSGKTYTNVKGLPLHSNKSPRPDNGEEISFHSTTPGEPRQHKPMLCYA